MSEGRASDIPAYHLSMTRPSHSASGTRQSRRRRLVGAISLSLIVAAGCGGDGGAETAPDPRPSSPAELTIESPVNGQVLADSTVPLRVSLENAEIVPQTSTNLVPDKGHIHVYLDDRLAGMNFALEEDLQDVAPGMHVLRVEFVAVDHAPFNPRVFAEVAFVVGA
jgi:hypothetical protein